MSINDPTDNKRRAAYLARAITRGDKDAIKALESEFPGETKRIEEYRKAYYTPTHPEHQRMVKDVASWYEAAADWIS